MQQRLVYTGLPVCNAVVRFLDGGSSSPPFLSLLRSQPHLGVEGARGWCYRQENQLIVVVVSLSFAL